MMCIKIGIKQASKIYNLPFVSATLRLIDDIKKYNKINGPTRELDRLSLQKYALDQACLRQSQSLVALAKLKMTESEVRILTNRIYPLVAKILVSF
jgi:hypothetical protein